MAKSSSKRRPTLLVALLVAVGLAAAYLGNCIPGFGAGTGGSADPSSTERSAPDPEPAKAAEVEPKGEAAPAVVQITVEGERCKTADGDVPCTDLCTRTPEATRVEVDATVGSHGTVEALRKCLDEAGYTDVRVVSR